RPTRSRRWRLAFAPDRAGRVDRRIAPPADQRGGTLLLRLSVVAPGRGRRAPRDPAGGGRRGGGAAAGRRAAPPAGRRRGGGGGACGGSVRHPAARAGGGRYGAGALRPRPRRPRRSLAARPSVIRRRRVTRQSTVPCRGTLSLTHSLGDQ